MQPPVPMPVEPVVVRKVVKSMKQKAPKSTKESAKATADDQPNDSPTTPSKPRVQEQKQAQTQMSAKHSTRIPTITSTSSSGSASESTSGPTRQSRSEEEIQEECHWLLVDLKNRVQERADLQQRQRGEREVAFNDSPASRSGRSSPWSKSGRLSRGLSKRLSARQLVVGDGETTESDGTAVDGGSGSTVAAALEEEEEKEIPSRPEDIEAIEELEDQVSFIFLYLRISVLPSAIMGATIFSVDVEVLHSCANYT